MRSLFAMLLMLGLMLLPVVAQPPASPSPAPKLEAIAETKLLMEGIAHPNFHGLSRNLKQNPANVETWSVVRGQALLIAESANLLMLRPPREKTAQDVWLKRATELRDSASALGRSAAAKDFPAARVGLATVANSCNRCHESFRVPTRVVPFDAE